VLCQHQLQAGRILLRMSLTVYLRVYCTATNKERLDKGRTRHGLHHLQCYQTYTHVGHRTVPYCGVSTTVSCVYLDLSLTARVVCCSVLRGNCAAYRVVVLGL
jgi:hypothetical protein